MNIGSKTLYLEVLIQINCTVPLANSEGAMTTARDPLPPTATLRAGAWNPSHGPAARKN